jgi:hypothetical protein
VDGFNRHGTNAATGTHFLPCYLTASVSNASAFGDHLPLRSSVDTRNRGLFATGISSSCGGSAMVTRDEAVAFSRLEGLRLAMASAEVTRD